MSSELPDLPQRLARVETVVIDGDELVAVVLEGEGVAVPVRTVCIALGVDVSNQSDRLREHDVLARGLRIVKAPLDGRVRAVVAILHDYIPFWLATITPSQVRPDVRPKLVRYQTELKDLLAAVYGTEAPAPETDALRALKHQLQTTVQELRLLRAQLLATTQQSAQQVEAQDMRITTIEGVLDTQLGTLARQVAEHQHLIDEHITITAAQQQQIKGTVLRLAKLHEKRTGQDVYGRLFGEFCWALSTPRYDALPASKYEQALDWLRAKAAELGFPEAVQEQQERLL